ncbi:MAG TPA: ATP-dependent helicase DinG, partial [Paenibacillaceae bacterium]|nr:ATP-dependent helicase DinG [Paenibacillaceae bacterium]
TAKVFIQLLQKMKGLPLITIQRLKELTRSYQSDLSELLKSLEKEKLFHTREETGIDVYRQLCLRSEQKQKMVDDSPIPEDFTLFMDQLVAEGGGLEKNL